MNEDAQFNAANRAVTQAAVKIEHAITDLLDQTRPFDCVAFEYVIERLADVLIERNPKALDYINEHGGRVTMQLANALMDWRDLWVDRY
jgi:hypothetical protein